MVILLTTILSGCGEQKQEEKADEPEQAIESASPAGPAMTPNPESSSEPAELPETEAGTGRQDGERFEDTIMLEGTEETVKYMDKAFDTQSPELLQTVYVFPAGDGSIVATAHYTIESAEGFGHLFDQMINTLAVIE